MRVDSREPDMDLGVEPEKLDCGDYIVGDFIIERKAGTDFISSVRSGSLYRQMAEMMKQDYDPVVLIEGNLDTAAMQANANMSELLHHKASIMMEGVTLVETGSRYDTVKFLKSLESQTDGTPKRPIRPVEKVDNRARFIVEGLPDIGPNMAEKLLGEFGDPETVITATKDDLMEVSGVGEKTAEKIRNSVN